MAEVPRPKIFISHSANVDPAKRLLECIETRLGTAGFELLVDRTRLNALPGALWRDALNAWLEICDGAVILCSREAMQSDWVKAEAVILNHRWRRGTRSFPLLLGLVGDVTPEEIGQDFLRVTDLSDGQVLRSELQDTLPERAEAFFEGLKQRYDDSPAMRRERDLLACLKDCDESALAAAARRIGVDLAYWAPELQDKRKALARLLLQSTLTDVANALQAIPERMLVNRLEVIELIEPSWVNILGVDWLRETALEPQAPKAVALNTGREHIARCYIQRASFVEGQLWKPLVVPYRQGEGAETEFEQDLDEAVVRALNADPEDGPAEWKQSIAAIRKRRQAVLLIQKKLPQLRQRIEAVRSRYGEIIVLVLADDDQWESTELVTPPIEHESERRYLDDRRTARAMLGKGS